MTPPRDQLAPGSDAVYKADAAAIKADVDQTIRAIGGKRAIVAVPPPATQTFTGIPVADVQDWLGGAYEDVELKRLIAAYQAAIKNELYLQATAGIIPSAMRDLHQRVTPEKDAPMTAEGAALSAVDLDHRQDVHQQELPGLRTRQEAPGRPRELGCLPGAASPDVHVRRRERAQPDQPLRGLLREQQLRQGRLLVTTTEKISRGLSRDEPPAAVRAASGKQRAVPMEYRRIPEHPDADGVEAIFLRIANEVRNLNTKHMDPPARADIIEKAKTG